MPTATFYKLSEDKQKTILSAIKKEFSTAELSEISVNRIVEESKIAKGSFYQYFKDKDEAIIYILKEFIHSKKQEIKNIVKLNKGDIFKSTIILFENVLNDKQNEQDIKFIKNAVQGIAAKGINIIEIKNETCIESFDDSILECIDISKYNMTNIFEIKAMLELIVRTFGSAVIGVLDNKAEYANIKKLFVFQLEIIRNGILKEECR